MTLDFLTNEKDLDLMEVKSLPLEAERISGRQPLVAQITALDENDNEIQREVNQQEKRLIVKDDVAQMNFQPGDVIFVTIKVNAYF